MTRTKRLRLNGRSWLACGTAVAIAGCSSGRDVPHPFGEDSAVVGYGDGSLPDVSVHHADVVATDTAPVARDVGSDAPAMTVTDAGVRLMSAPTTGAVTGVVLDPESGTALANVAVAIDDAVVAHTDTDGRFELETTAGPHALKLSLTGRLAVTQTVAVGGTTAIVRVRLERAAPPVSIGSAGGPVAASGGASLDFPSGAFPSGAMVSATWLGGEHVTSASAPLAFRNGTSDARIVGTMVVDSSAQPGMTVGLTTPLPTGTDAGDTTLWLLGADGTWGDSRTATTSATGSATFGVNHFSVYGLAQPSPSPFVYRSGGPSSDLDSLAYADVTPVAPLVLGQPVALGHALHVGPHVGASMADSEGTVVIIDGATQFALVDAHTISIAHIDRVFTMLIRGSGARVVNLSNGSSVSASGGMLNVSVAPCSVPGDERFAVRLQGGTASFTSGGQTVMVPSGMMADECARPRRAGTDAGAVSADAGPGTPACVVSADCPAGFRCDPYSNQCVRPAGASCHTDVECIPGTNCTSGLCVSPPSSTGVPTCMSNAECAFGQRCDLNTRACVTAPAGTPTGCTPACAAGFVCRPDGVCVPDAATTGMDAGTACSAPRTMCAASCVDTATDVANCGACGNACGAMNGTATCASGSCGYVCAAGYGDCDGNASNGCETSLASSATNCGTCGHPCGASEACSAGACMNTGTCLPGTTMCGVGACRRMVPDCLGGVPQTCTPGTPSAETCNGADDDCNGQTDEGLTGCAGGVCGAGTTMCSGGCTNLQSDAANCGACSNACALTNATAMCVAGSCDIGACATGFGNCDGRADNGCETNLQVDVANCGTCGTACNAGEACSAGACTGGSTCTPGTTMCGVGACRRMVPNCVGGVPQTCAPGTPSAETCNGMDDDCNGLTDEGLAGCGSTCGAGLSVCNLACTDTQTDANNCGTCGRACGAGQGCTAGSCRVLNCAAPTVNCGGHACVDPLTDATNCGGCNHVCGAGQTCAAGSCGGTSCGAGTVNCGGACANLQTDATNCGGCGIACGAGQTCTAGTCGSASCGAGTMNCGGGTCANLQTDALNCGGCGHVCGAGQGCTAGTCRVLNCVAPTVNCGGHACVDPQTDATNCGGCNHGCNAGQGCTSGACMALNCGAGTVNCGGHACVDPLTDASNCGGCNHVCGAGQTCASGSCGGTSCGAGTVNCGGACANLQTDATNCGGCGIACSAGQTCTAGTCGSGSCGAGTVSCSGTCANLQTDALNCGGCGHVCGAGRTCSAGACVTGGTCLPGVQTCGVGACQRTVPNCVGGVPFTCVPNTPSAETCNGIDDDCNGLTDEGLTGCVACGGGLTSCNSACTDTQSDGLNCGACNLVCGAGQSCIGGACSAPCAAGTTNCGGGTCTDTSTDVTNCGGCGTVCGAGQSCISGACMMAPCGAGTTNCAGTCVDMNTDVNNCGACGHACQPGPNSASTCSAGACAITCVPGFLDCNGIAADGCEFSGPSC